MSARTIFLAALAVAALGCKPDLDDTVSIVSTAQVLAVQSIPAEAPPGGSVTYTALVAQGNVPDAGPVRLVWDYCSARNPLKNLGPVNVACVQQGSPSLSRLGGGLHAVGGVPSSACSNFGPNPPPAVDGGVPGQPVNPDFTGGYYQPVTVFESQASTAADTLYFMRLSCGFAGANEASQAALTARYHPNTNPEVAALTASGTAWVPTNKGGKNAVARGAQLELEVSWPACPLIDRCGDGVCGADESAVTCPKDCISAAGPDGGAPPPPKGCAGAERYVNFDLESQNVVDQREGIHVSWYASDGAFAQDRTGVTGSDTTTNSPNGWTAPAQTETVTVWVVLRDDRGGIGWAEYRLEVN